MNQPDDRRISRLEEATERIEASVNSVREDLRLLWDKITATLEKVEEHERILRGSGAEPGVVAQVKAMNDTLAELKSILKGEKDDPGMVGEIRQISRQMDKREEAEKWLVRLVAAYVIVEVTKAVLGAL